MILSRLEKTLFVALGVFLLWSRFWYLGIIPSTLPHDEMVYAIQARSFSLQQRTLDQQQSFFTLEPSHAMYAEWPAQVMSLGFLLTDKPLLATHLVSATMGIAFPFLMAIIVWNIWKKERLTKLTWLIFVLSPMIWQMSRLSYDAWYGVWFFVLAGALFTHRNSKVSLASIPFLMLGFFQYQGYKLLLLPWLLFLQALMLSTQVKSLQWPELKKHTAKISWRWVPIAFAVALTLFFGLVLLPGQQQAGRLSDLIFTDSEFLAQQVNSERTLTISNPFQKLATNKLTVILSFMLDRYAGVFDFGLLLRSLEPNRSGFTVWSHGIFTLAEFALFIIGLVGLVTNKRTRATGLVLLGGILTLCLPALINTGSPWYFLRSFFSYLLLTLAAAWGLEIAWPTRWLRVVMLSALMIGLLNFTYQYWFRYPVISLDWGNFDERVIARYVHLSHQEHPEVPITVYSREPEYFFWSYLLYSQALTHETADEVAQSQQKFRPMGPDSVYTLGNVTFSARCAPNEPQNTGEVSIVQIEHARCDDEPASSSADLALSPVSVSTAPVLSVLAVLDSGERFRIYGDATCESSQSGFVHLQRLKQLAVETQEAPEFCDNWIKNLNIM